MARSILTTVKQGLGPSIIYDAFDPELIIHINSVLRILNQLGVGVKGYSVTDASQTWEEFMPENTEHFDEAISYTINKVRLIFDPPTNSFLVANIEKLCSEFEWRLNVEADPGDMP